MGRPAAARFPAGSGDPRPDPTRPPRNVMLRKHAAVPQLVSPQMFTALVSDASSESMGERGDWPATPEFTVIAEKPPTRQARGSWSKEEVVSKTL